MRKEKLNTAIVVIVSLLTLYGTIGVLLKHGSHEFEVWRSCISLVLAVPAAILSYYIQRRNSYLQSLRDLWKQLLPAVQSAIQYTHIDSPNQKEYASVKKELNVVIDLIRGIFKNVPVEGSPTDLYPYENLKDIDEVISYLSYGTPQKQKKNARRPEDALYNFGRKCLMLC